MKSSARNALRLLTLVGAGAGSVWLSMQLVQEIETRSKGAIEAALAEAGHDWASVETDGLRAYLRGEAPDEATRFRATSVASTILNPANLRDEMTVTETMDITPPAYRVDILRTGNDVTLHGLVPTPTDAALSVPDRLAALGPDLDLSDLLTRGSAPANPRWTAALNAGLTAVSQLPQARISVTEQSVRIEALARDRTQQRTLETQLRSMLPATVALELDIKTPRPVIAPFLTRFILDANGSRFDACAAGTEDGARAIEAAAERAGYTGTAGCNLGLGAPDPEWDTIVARAISAVGDLGAGAVTVSDLTITLVTEPETPSDTVSEVVTRLQDTLPGLFTLSVLTPDDTVPGGPDASLAFSATRSPEGLTNLRGPLDSGKSRAVVETYANALFADGGLHQSLRQLPGLPDDWTVKVLAGLEALSDLESGALTVSPAKITLRGITGDEGAKDRIARALTDALGPQIFLELDVTYDERLDPIAALPTAQECVDRVNGILAQDKITFSPGATDLDIDALRIVDRLAEALQDCPPMNMEVGGHTDSQGREEMNTLLSQARADSVFNALLARDVLTANLTSRGYGESTPIADNATSAGREENRRIEFQLLDTDGAPLEDTPEDTTDAAPETGNAEPTQQETPDGSQ